MTSGAPWAIDLCRDMGFLDAQRAAIGLRGLEQGLRRAAAAHGGWVAAIHRAFRAELHVLRREPTSLSARIHYRLRCGGVPAADIEREISFPEGVPALRVRFSNECRQSLLRLEGHRNGVWACAAIPDGRRAVSASRDGTLRVWELESGEILAILRGHSGEVRACAALPDGRRVVSAASDSTLKIWDLESGQALDTLVGHEARVLACAVSTDGQRIVSASADRSLRVWSVETGETLAVFAGHAAPIRSCALTADGERVVSSSEDGTVKSWRLETGTEVTTPKMDTGKSLVALSRLPPTWGSGVLLASGEQRAVVETGHGLQVFECETGQLVRSLALDRDPNGAPGSDAVCLGPHALSECERWVAFFETERRRVMIWDLESGDVLSLLDAAQRGFVTTLAQRCALLGGSLLTWADDGAIRACVQIQPERDLFQWTTADGRRLVTYSLLDGSLQVWDVATCRVIHTIAHAPPPAQPFARSFAATPDGRYLVTACPSAGVSVWDLATGSARAKLRIDWEQTASTGVAATNEAACVVDGLGGAWILELSLLA